MTKVVVIGAPAEDPELKKLLEAAECELVDESDDEEAEEDETQAEQPEAGDLESNELAAKADDDDCGDGLIIVVLTPECSSDRDLEEIVKTSVAKGKRVIGLWPKGSDAGEIPPCINQFGDDVITWDPVTLRRVVRQEKPQWQMPAGGARPEPEVKRNC